MEQLLKECVRAELEKSRTHSTVELFLLKFKRVDGFFQFLVLRFRVFGGRVDVSRAKHDNFVLVILFGCCLWKHLI